MRRGCQPLRALRALCSPRLGGRAALKKKEVEATARMKKKMRGSLELWCTVILSITHLTASWRLRWIQIWHCNFNAIIKWQFPCFTSHPCVVPIDYELIVWCCLLQPILPGRKEAMENVLYHFRQQLLMVHSEKLLKNDLLLKGAFLFKAGKSNVQALRKSTNWINQQPT